MKMNRKESNDGIFNDFHFNFLVKEFCSKFYSQFLHLFLLFVFSSKPAIANSNYRKVAIKKRKRNTNDSVLFSLEDDK